MLHTTIPLYENRKDVTLTTYVGEHSLAFLPDVKRPAILICPGGAYMTCADGEGEPVATAFNALGYQAFVLRYSTYMEGRPGIPEPGKPLPPKEHCQFPHPMEDIAAAMRLLIKNQELWRLNPEEIILTGFSAGAHNCGMYSVYWKKYGFPRPKAAILGYCLADYGILKHSPMDDFARMMFRMSNVAICGKEDIDDETIRLLSIPDNVDENTPPMFLWNTSEDEQIPAVSSLKIAEVLLAHGIPAELHMFENGPHGLSTANACSAVMQGQIRPDISVWVPLAHTWLQKRIHINLPTKMPF